MRINIGKYTLLVKWGVRIDVHQSWAMNGGTICDCLRTEDHHDWWELR